MRLSNRTIYRVVEQRPDGLQRKYIALGPHGLDDGFQWFMNKNQISVRVLRGDLEDHKDGFKVVPSDPNEATCFFEPLNLVNVKDAGLMPDMQEEIAFWDDDSDATEFYENYFREILDSPAFQSMTEEVFHDEMFDLTESRGIPAEPGEIHKWKDGDYEKQRDGSWRKVGSEWTDTHPDVSGSTKSKFFDPKTGTWDPARRKLHDEILNEVRPLLFGDAKPVPADKQPVFTFIMGPPASGKSTRVGDAKMANTVVLDPDEIVVRLPEFKKAVEVKARNGAGSVVEEAMLLNNRLISEVEAGRYNYCISGTGGNLEWMQTKLFPELKKKGYKINVLMSYVADLDELLLRVESRGHRDGRFVPPERTESLHRTLPKNFLALMSNKDLDSLALFNTHVTRPGASKMQSDVAFVQSAASGKQEVLDPDFFNEVMAMADPA